MVGELDVAIAGHQATIEFLSEQILFRFPNYRSARAISIRPLPSYRPLTQLLLSNEIVVRAQIGRREPFEIFPRPNWFVRWFSPAIRRMMDTWSPESTAKN